MSKIIRIIGVPISGLLAITATPLFAETGNAKGTAPDRYIGKL